MHDPTEGGLLGGLVELARASNVGFRVEEELIPVARETVEICSSLGVDSLSLISSGVLLVTVKPEGEQEALEAIKSVGVNCTTIGRITSGGRVLVRRSGEEVKLGMFIREELWDALEAKPR